MKNTNKILFFIFIMIVIAISELIGVQIINVGTIKILVLPLVFAVLITMIVGIPKWRKGILKKIYSDANIKFAGANLIFIMLPLMARYGADVAPKINEIMQFGWVFLFQTVGNVGTVLLGLPIALLLGLNREAIGATLGIGREGELAYITEKNGLDSEEGRGILSMYLVGTLFGALIFSFIPPILNAVGFDYRALAIGSGLGSASMMTAASSAIVGLYPQHADTITSFAGASQLVTSFMGTYIMVFLSVPLMNFIYKIFKKERAIN
ncbi:DUF3100 domain-containing protein [Erysipelothrix sp. HDW6C]|uniref:DUF3100 domain-containing protein n=1 Tax=Erysipelothrix sp. HDW6C TaxID=2714930 RepID=UPI00140B6971|nr:DUF3100 domain-containing protein [Erysipelothrix sp. HDW6C]QIK69550.1 DUF3100 domain-containing protein [Erysipelothrix sp. HDW6C]